MASSRDISTTRSYLRYDAPLPLLTGPRAQKGVTGESLNKRRRLDIKNCSSREKRWLYCADANDGASEREPEEENNLPVMWHPCRCGVTQEEVQPARGFTSLIPERDAFLTEVETSLRCAQHLAPIRHEILDPLHHYSFFSIGHGPLCNLRPKSIQLSFCLCATFLLEFKFSRHKFHKRTVDNLIFILG